MIVYTRYKQVYQGINRYILMTCQYIPVFIIVISIVKLCFLQYL